MLIVIPSVGYADFLAVTLPAWQAFAPNARIRVVTSPDDRETFRVASDAGVGCVVTDVWHRGGALFNKAEALDEAFELRNPLGPTSTACLATDADVVPVGRLPDLQLSRGVLYGCARYACDTPADLARVRAGELGLEQLPLLLARHHGENRPRRQWPHTAADAVQVARAGLGYFQLFAWRPGLRFGSSQTAGGYDQRFAGQFTLRTPLPGVAVLHLGAQDRANWTGRVVPRWGAS